MSKREKKSLVPELRFPEFKNSAEWKKQPLSSYIEEYSERASSNTELEVYSSTRDGLKPQNEYYDGRNLENEGEYGVVPNDYFVYRHMSDDDVFKFNLNQLGKKIAVSKEYPVFKTINLDARFLLNHLNEGAEFKRFAATQKKGGTRTRLYLSTLRTFESFLPAFEEQQKIADCLAFIDELINTQTQKLATFKSHKKGLLQQLFPTEGETTPNLRLPEFRDLGVWEIDKLGQCLSRHPEYGINAPAVPYSENLPKYLRITDISEDGEIRQDKNVSVAKNVTDDDYLDEGDIVLARTGASVGKSYKYRTEDGKFVFAGFLIRIKPNVEKLNSEFLSQFLSTDRYWRWINLTSARSGQPGINSNEISLLPIPLPPTLNEQQKIADFLASVDSMISNQVKKIETLRAHKKGLMQQLFPALDEVSI